MEEKLKAKEPFSFYTRMHLTELTGIRATNLVELLACIKKVPESSIYHHTHRFLQQHQYLSPEPPNDFAYWVTEILAEKVLGEELASIDIIQFTSIESLRAKIASVIEEFMKNNESSKSRSVTGHEAFSFMKSVSFILPTGYAANDLAEFVRILGEVSIDSIYFHIFEARLRLGKRTNDFSFWIETSVGDKKLADAISRLDPYTYTLEDLRKTIIEMVMKRITK